MRIAVVGLWHLGEVVSVGLAELGHTVLAIDEDTKVVGNLKRAIPPLPEKDIAERIVRHLKDGSLSFSTDGRGVKDCDAIFLPHDTPVDENDESDIESLRRPSARLSKNMKNYVFIAALSQLPV